MLNVLLNILGAYFESPGAGPTPPPVFPCTITAGTTYTLTADVITNCDPILVETNGTLVIDQPYILTQNNP